MPNHYVEDYEQLTGLSKDVTVHDEVDAEHDEAPDVTAKVFTGPPVLRPAMSKAETK